MKKMLIAITGPSGSGKTTLGDLLINREGFVTPLHSTTRSPRLDDKAGFYRYLSHDEFKYLSVNSKFLFWSGDDVIIDKSKGNYYGILKSDYTAIYENSRLLFFISYKDISNVMNLNTLGLDVNIVNLRFADLENTMKIRLSVPERGHTSNDIESRIKCAKQYEEQFSNELSNSNILKIPSDVLSIEDTYSLVRRKIILKERN